MRLPITPVNTLLRDLRAQLRQHHAGGRLLVAVDALPSTPTAAFADDFAAVLGEDGTDVFRALADDFLVPRSQRRTSERGPDWFDEETFRRVLIDPFRSAAHTSAATGFQLRAWDERRDQPAESSWTTTGDDAVLVVDGPFLHAPRLRGLWHFSVWLQRDQATLEPQQEASTPAGYTPAEAAYLREDPAQHSGAVVDVTDPQHPAQRFLDSC